MMTKPIFDAYEFLGVSRDATMDEIKIACQKCQEDMYSDPLDSMIAMDKLKKYQQAFVLLDVGLAYGVFQVKNVYDDYLRTDACDSGKTGGAMMAYMNLQSVLYKEPIVNTDGYLGYPDCEEMIARTNRILTARYNCQLGNDVHVHHDMEDIYHCLPLDSYTPRMTIGLFKALSKYQRVGHPLMSEHEVLDKFVNSIFAIPEQFDVPEYSFDIGGHALEEILMNPDRRNVSEIFIEIDDDQWSGFINYAFRRNLEIHSKTKWPTSDQKNEIKNLARLSLLALMQPHGLYANDKCLHRYMFEFARSHAMYPDCMKLENVVSGRGAHLDEHVGVRFVRPKILSKIFAVFTSWAFGKNAEPEFLNVSRIGDVPEVGEDVIGNARIRGFVNRIAMERNRINSMVVNGAHPFMHDIKDGIFKSYNRLLCAYKRDCDSQVGAPELQRIGVYLNILNSEVERYGFGMDEIEQKSILDLYKGFSKKMDIVAEKIEMQTSSNRTAVFDVCQNLIKQRL